MKLATFLLSFIAFAAAAEVKPFATAESYAFALGHGDPTPGQDGSLRLVHRIYREGATSLSVELRVDYLPSGWSVVAAAPRHDDQILDLAFPVVQTWPTEGDILTLVATGPAETASHLHVRVTRLFVGNPTLSAVTAKNEDQANPTVNFTCKAADDPAVRPLGDGTVHVIVDGRFECSGSFINHPTADQVPLIMTATHCADAIAGDDAFGLGQQGRVLARTRVQTPCGEALTASSSSSVPTIRSVATRYADYSPDGDASTANDHWIIEMDRYPVTERPILLFGTDFAQQEPGVRISSVHHANGRTQQWASGVITSYGEFGDGPFSPGSRASARYNADLDEGCTAPGASGSPVVIGFAAIVATHFGGTTACRASSTPLSFSSGDAALRAILPDDQLDSKVLPLVTPTPAPTPLPTPVATPTPTAPPQSGGGGGALGSLLIAFLGAAALHRRLRASPS